MCPGARVNESLTASTWLVIREIDGEDEDMPQHIHRSMWPPIDWTVPFKRGKFKISFAWQHYNDYGEEVGFDDISPTMLWNALNPKLDGKRGPFFM